MATALQIKRQACAAGTYEQCTNPQLPCVIIQTRLPKITAVSEECLFQRRKLWTDVLLLVAGSRFGSSQKVDRGLGYASLLMARASADTERLVQLKDETKSSPLRNFIRRRIN